MTKEKTQTIDGEEYTLKEVRPGIWYIYDSGGNFIGYVRKPVMATALIRRLKEIGDKIDGKI